MIIPGDKIFGFTTLAGCLYCSTNTVNAATAGGKPHPEVLKRSTSTSVVTGVPTTTLTGYSLGRQMSARQASAYIESLDDTQLAELEQMLSEKEITNTDTPKIKML